MKKLILFIIITSITTLRAGATTYYVSVSGSDTNDGKVLSRPYRTIKKGLRSLIPGDTLLIKSGIYNETLHSGSTYWPSGTSWTSPIKVSVYPGDSVTLKGVIGFEGPVPYKYIIVDGLIIDAINDKGSPGAVSILDGSHHIRFQNCHIKNSYINGVMIGWGSRLKSSDYNEFINCKISNSGRKGGTQVNGINYPGPDTSPGFGRGHGLYIENSYNLIKNCKIFSNGEFGIKFYYGNYASGLKSNYNVIRESTLYQNGQNTTRYGHPIGGGILLATGTENKAINNLVYNHSSIHLAGIETGYHSVNSKIYNNTIYNSGVGISVLSSSANASIKNNIVYTTTFLQTRSLGTGTVWNNNLIGVDPKFVRLPVDFRLQSSSPAVNKGVSLTDVKNDILGVSRPQGGAYDIGAYESSTVSAGLTVSAGSTSSSAILKWPLNSESDLAGYRIWRSTVQGVYGWQAVLVTLRGPVTSTATI
jgi:parallel beta-helix repeat protein